MGSAKKRARRIVFLGALILLGPSMHSIAAESNRFSLTGTGTLSTGQPAQKNDRWQLKASLSPATPLPAMQADGRFALAGVLSASSLVCYNDTIFRDDFDGDGF